MEYHVFVWNRMIYTNFFNGCNMIFDTNMTITTITILTIITITLRGGRSPKVSLGV